ncbi:MAG: hypothetical protein ACTS4T_01230 [Candidatus Hodgkinia cicadicola]
MIRTDIIGRCVWNTIALTLQRRTFNGCVMFYNFILIVSSPKSRRAFWKLLLPPTEVNLTFTRPLQSNNWS